MILCDDHEQSDCPIAYILMHLRPWDCREIDECGFPLTACARAFHSEPIIGRLFYDLEGKPAAICTFHALTPKALQVSLVATERWDEVATQVYRWGVKTARPALVAAGFKRAECRTMEGYADAIRLLEHLGFTLETRLAHYGRSGQAFLQYAWRLDDHAYNGTAIAEQFVSERAGHRAN